MRTDEHGIALGEIMRKGRGRGRELEKLSNRKLQQLMRAVGLKVHRTKNDNLQATKTWRRHQIEERLFKDQLVRLMWMHYDRADCSIGYVVTIIGSGGLFLDIRYPTEVAQRKEERRRIRILRELMRDTSKHFRGTVWRRMPQWETRETTLPGFHFHNFGDMADFVAFNKGRRPIQHVEYPDYPVSFVYGRDA